jgi:hypothetical protein
MKHTLSRLSLVLTLALCLCLGERKVQGQFVPPGRKNFLITITSGTPIQVSATAITIDRILVQMAKGGSGLGYICTTAVGTTPSSKCSGSGQLAAQLAPASSIAPGGSYSDTTPASGTAGMNAQVYWIDGDVNGDVVIVSMNVR